MTCPVFTNSTPCMQQHHAAAWPQRLQSEVLTAQGCPVGDADWSEGFSIVSSGLLVRGTSSPRSRSRITPRRAFWPWGTSALQDDQQKLPRGCGRPTLGWD